MGFQMRTYGPSQYLFHLKILVLKLSFSTKNYFGMFALIAILPLVHTFLTAYSGFPLREQTFDKSAFQNESIFVFLDLNLTDVQEFPLFIPNDQV